MTIASSKANTSSPDVADSNASVPLELLSETRILLEGVSWETFERLLEETGSSRNQRFAYCEGFLEIMVPLKGHEEPNRLFEHFVAAMVDGLGLELCSLGALTMKNVQQKKGLEPDCCFYIANEAVVRGIEALDFEVHPPPDLVVEVDNSSTSLKKFPIYEALRIPEIWRLRHGKLTIYQLNQEGAGHKNAGYQEAGYREAGYREAEQSLAFPQLPILELPQFIARAKVIGQRAAVRELRQRVQQSLATPEMSPEMSPETSPETA